MNEKEQEPLAPYYIGEIMDTIDDFHGYEMVYLTVHKINGEWQYGIAVEEYNSRYHREEYLEDGIKTVIEKLFSTAEEALANRYVVLTEAKLQLLQQKLKRMKTEKTQKRIKDAIKEVQKGQLIIFDYASETYDFEKYPQGSPHPKKVNTWVKEEIEDVKTNYFNMA